MKAGVSFYLIALRNVALLYFLILERIKYEWIFGIKINGTYWPLTEKIIEIDPM